MMIHSTLAPLFNVMFWGSRGLLEIFRVVMDDSDMLELHSMIVCGHVHAFLTLGAGVPHADKHANARQIE